MIKLYIVLYLAGEILMVQGPFQKLRYDKCIQHVGVLNRQLWQEKFDAVMEGKSLKTIPDRFACEFYDQRPKEK